MNQPSLDQIQDLFNKNPRFISLSNEIHLPFTFEQYKENQQHQATLIHEYMHLIQARATVYGIYNFIGLTERYVFLFDAIFNRQELKFPIMNWANGSDDKTLKAYYDYEKSYLFQYFVGAGKWLLESDASNFELQHLSKKIGDNEIKRWHVVREFNKKKLAVPLLALAHCEAQAESVATYFQGIESPILKSINSEKKEDALFYTSIFALLSVELPQFSAHLHELIYMLTDYALMTYAPDEAFRRGLLFLKNHDSPATLSQWKDLRDLMEKNLQLESRSLQNLHEEIDKKIRVYRKTASHVLTDLFVKQLEQAKTFLELRVSDPFYFFPWDRKMATFQEKILSNIPMAHVQFSDGVYGLGNPSEEALKNQAILSGATFLLDVLHGNKSGKCPYVDDKTICTAVRTLECSQFPWGRGDIGNSLSCIQGTIGIVLKIDQSSISHI